MRAVSRSGNNDPEVANHDGVVNWVGPARGPSTTTTAEPLIGPRGSTVTTGEGGGNGNVNGDVNGNELRPERTLSMGPPRSADDIHQPYQLP